MAIKKGNILIVDDDKDVLSSLKLFLKYEFESITPISNPNMIPDLLLKNDFDIILLDMNFSAGLNTGNEGLYWLQEIKKRDEHAVVVMITAYGDIDLAIKAIKQGATDFIVKPWDNDKLVSTLQSGIELKATRKQIQKASGNALASKNANHETEIVRGESAGMKNIYTMLGKVAPTDANILLLGENGTGKEVLARDIHNKSNRAKDVFIAVDLGAISETLFESELFGHVKGAFTDAKDNKKGHFEAASGGTLFLDEIGNLSLPLQAKLLTAIQNRTITPVGSTKRIPVDVRIVSATNKNLQQMVYTGEFRQDLLYRINTITIDIPPLRDRENDVILLADFYLKYFCTKYSKQNLSFDSNAKKVLVSHLWPGNIRELRHVIEKAVILSSGDKIIGDELISSPQTLQHQSNEMNLDKLEEDAVKNALHQANNNMSEAARILGVSRPTLYKKITKYGIR